MWETRPRSSTCLMRRSKLSGPSMWWSTTPALCRSRRLAREMPRCSTRSFRPTCGARSSSWLRRRSAWREAEGSLHFPAACWRGRPTYGPYIASKAGVEGLVHVLANEMRGRNITVNAVAPGPVGTELFLKGKSEARINELKKLPPLERLGVPEDISNVVSFLAGPDGGWV